VSFFYCRQYNNLYHISKQNNKKNVLLGNKSLKIRGKHAKTWFHRAGDHGPGDGQSDHGALVRFYEKLAKTEVRRKTMKTQDAEEVNFVAGVE